MQRTFLCQDMNKLSYWLKGNASECQPEILKNGIYLFS